MTVITISIELKKKLKNAIDVIEKLQQTFSKKIEKAFVS